MSTFQGKKSGLTRFILLLFTAIFVAFSQPASAFSEEAEDAPTAGESPTGFILHHIKDSHNWHFATIGHTHVTLPLPVILYSAEKGLDVFMSSNFYDENHNLKPYNGYIFDEEHDHIYLESNEKASLYDFSITKNVAQLFITLIILMLIFFSIASKYKKNPKKAPSGLQSLFEPIIIFVRDEIVKPNIGPKKYERFMPYLLTLFFFIWFANLFGLLPGAANLTGNIAVTFTLAVITFIVTNVNGNKDYWKHIFATPGVPKPVLLILVPVEFLGLFTKPFALMIRLFVSITAGHIVILSIIALGFIFSSYAIGIGGSLLVIFINIIELLVATIQAYVFTLFTSMYIGSAVAEHEHDVAH
ncbi:MAG: F0F1 ATP synthase subunit A [Cyclobacteriaceae bacterium]